jgi:hypothetical protein
MIGRLQAEKDAADPQGSLVCCEEQTRLATAKDNASESAHFAVLCLARHAWRMLTQVSSTSLGDRVDLLKQVLREHVRQQLLHPDSISLDRHADKLLQLFLAFLVGLIEAHVFRHLQVEKTARIHSYLIDQGAASEGVRLLLDRVDPFICSHTNNSFF